MNEPAIDQGMTATGGIKCSIRYCFYLHLGTARKNGKKWLDHRHRCHPVFEVQGKARWVLAYQETGSEWIQIFQLTSKIKTDSGKVKPHHELLGQIIPSKVASIPAEKSWVQCSPERYPAKLIVDAEEYYEVEPITLDRNVAKAYLDIIMAKSSNNWFLRKPQ